MAFPDSFSTERLRAERLSAGHWEAMRAMDADPVYMALLGGPRTEAKGIVVVTTGFTPSERTYYERQQKRGVIVATTFPSGDQVGSPVSSRENAPTISVERMLPTHARILLMLALTKTQDPREIQRMFDQY